MTETRNRTTVLARCGLLLGVFTSLAAAQVDRRWVVRYDGSAHGSDYAQAIAVDDAGNIYVTGYAIEIGQDADFVTLKYAPNGNLLWSRTYDGDGYWDYAFALALDMDGVVVAGYSYGAATTTGDHVTLKYDSDGALQWSARYDQANQSDIGHRVKVDAAGNVYSAGWSSDGATHGFKILKYDADGALLWQRRYDGPGGGNDIAYDMELDPEGNVLITGASCGAGGYPCGQGPTGDYDIATLKYDANGNLLWERRYDGPGHWEDYPSALAVDAEGNAYVTGWATGQNTGLDCVTLKYDSAGNLIWERRYDGPTSEYDYGNDLAVDSVGNVFVTGASSSAQFADECITLMYDADGNLLWDRHYGSFSGGFGLAVALDASGNAYVTGASFGNWEQAYDFATLKYSPAGELLWEMRYDAMGGNDASLALVVDAVGSVYVTGFSLGAGTGLDLATVKYTQCAPGDLDGNGAVDLLDLATLLAHFGSSNAGPQDGDLNGDGEVNLEDLANLLAQFGTDCE